MPLILNIYIIAIVYILLFFIHKFFKFILSNSQKLTDRYQKRLIIRKFLQALDFIFNNILLLIISIVTIISISFFIIIIYIYYKFLLVPISKVALIGCEIYKIFAFFPIIEIKSTGIFTFLDKLFFKNKLVADALIKLILETTIKHNVSDEMFKNIEESIYKDKDTPFIINDICGDIKEKQNPNEHKRKYNERKPNIIKETDKINYKQQELINQCVITETANNPLNPNFNYTGIIKNKLLYNVCSSRYTFI